MSNLLSNLLIINYRVNKQKRAICILSLCYIALGYCFMLVEIVGNFLQ